MAQFTGLERVREGEFISKVGDAECVCIDFSYIHNILT